MNLHILIRSALFVITSLSGQAAPAQQRKDFIKVEAADMKSGVAEAVRAAKGSHAEGGFWVAYPLPVRPDVIIDPDKGEFVGDADDIHRLSIFIGRASNSPGGTRNAGVFMLYGPGGTNVTRVEVYNLDRAGKYRGLPVYWLGKPAAAESLSLLRGIIDANPGTDVAENATLALALHDDPAVRGALEQLALNSRDDRARKTALHWLGFTGGENELLARLVADDGQSVRVRSAAARALGAGSPAVPVATLRSLYTSVVEVEVRRALLYSISINPDRGASSDLLLEVAQHDFDPEARRQAAYWLSERGEGKR
jgi:hypothetical protein